MDANRLTERSQQAIARGAERRRCGTGTPKQTPNICWSRCIDQTDGLVPRLLSGLDADVVGLRDALRSRNCPAGRR